MTYWPVGLSTGCFHQRSITDVLEVIRTSGFSMIEICSFPAHLDYHNRNAVQSAGNMLRDLGIEAFSFHAPFRDTIDITSFDARQRDSSVHELMIAADAAASMGVGHFVIHPGPERTGKPPDTEYVDRMRNAAEVLTRVAAHSRSLGMALVLENMLPHLLFGQISDVLWIMGAIKDFNVSICLDTGHAHIGGDLYGAAHKLSGHLKIVHAHDNHGHRDEHLPPGHGNINWNRLVTSLTERSFSGTVVLELAANGDDPQQVLHKARDARQYLQEIIRQVDSPTIAGKEIE